MEVALLIFAVKFAAEDLGHGARYQRSPRLESRRRDDPNHGAGRGRVGVYVSSLIDDAEAAARARNSKRLARKKARNSGDGRFTDFDPDMQRWTPSCDVCGWVGRPYRIEAHADAERHRHRCSGAAPNTTETTDSNAGAHSEQRQVPRRPESAPEEPEVAGQTPTGGPVQQESTGKGSAVSTMESTRESITIAEDWIDREIAATSDRINSITEAQEALNLASASFSAAAGRLSATDVTSGCGSNLEDASQSVRAMAAAYQEAADALLAASAAALAALDSIRAAGSSLEAGEGDLQAAGDDAADEIAGATSGG